MLKGNFENALSQHENTGSRLEDEFVGNVNGRKYKEMAYTFLHKDEMNLDSLSPDEKMEKTLEMRERAAQEFEKPSDFKDNYINRRDSMRLIEKCQVGDPEHPSRFFAKKLYDNVRDRFSEKDFTVKFFTATGGTHLDVVHKIDCFFKLSIKETEREVACATMDLTLNNRKAETAADVLVKISDEEKDKCDPSRGNEQYDQKFLEEMIAKISQQVEDALVEDYQKRVQKN